MLSIKVIPGAHKSEIVGLENDRIKVRIAAQPEKGKANEALETFLAKALKISKSRVRVVKGLTSRLKEVEIEGMTLAEAQHLLLSP